MRNSSVLIFLLISVLAFPLIQVNADQPSQNTQSGNTIFSWSGTALSVEIEGEWNWSDTISLSEDNGIWSTEIELSEGLYCYKLIVDGVYIFDPSNPYRGYCGEYENSVVRVEDASRPNFESHIVDDILTVTFIPGIGGAGPEQIPNDLNGATWDVNNMQWTLDLSSFTEGKHTLHLEVNDTDSNPAYDEIIPFWIGEQADFSWEDSLIYMIMTDRYINGNISNDNPTNTATHGADWMGGDFEGVTHKIESGYFSNLGVNVLWLTPFNTNAQGTGLAGDGVHDVAAYHGYWPVEARQVDPRLGTADQLKTMVDAAHGEGIRVIMDYVVNHVHESHSYYQDNPEWFNQGCICGTSNCDWTEHRLDCQFTSYMPDVNWKQRNASEQFIEDALWWLEEFDLDGARIDAVKHVDDLAITNLATRVAQRFETVGTEYYLKGETAMGWAGHDLAANQEQYETINRYMGENGLDGQADFVLYHAVADNVFTSGTENYQHLDYWTNRSQDQYSQGSVMVPYVGSHDVPRLVSRADTGTGDAWNQWQEDGLPGQPGTDSPYQAALQAYGWLLTTPGAPMIYYGDEYGEFGGADPDNRHMYRNTTSWNDREASLFDNLSQLGQLRAESIALKQGVYSTRYASPDLLIYDMSHSLQNMSIILNRGPQFTYSGFSSSDLIKFGEASFSSGEITIPANSVTVIELGTTPEVPVIIGGCMDQAATNFNSEATQDDGSCQYPVEPIIGCTDQLALNFNTNATQDDNSCQYEQEDQDNDCADIQCDACPLGMVSDPNGGCCACMDAPEVNVEPGNQTNNSNSQTIQCTGCCGEVSTIIDDGKGCPSVQCERCDNVEVETKSSVSEFIRNGLVVSVFCGVVVLAIMSRKK
jgi:glycosidase